MVNGATVGPAHVAPWLWLLLCAAFPFHRFPEIIDHAAAKERVAMSVSGEPGQDDDRDSRPFLLEIGNGFNPIDFRHANVANQTSSSSRFLR